MGSHRAQRQASITSAFTRQQELAGRSCSSSSRPAGVRKQLTLDRLKGVVKLNHSAFAFANADLSKLMGELADAKSEADKLRTLRTLDSMSVTLDRLRHTSIGKVVARMAKSDASSTVRDVAQRLKDKWVRVVLGGSVMLSSTSQHEQRVQEARQRPPDAAFGAVVVEDGDS